MKLLSSMRAWSLATATALSLTLAVADTVETTDGSRLQGRILKVEGGVIEIETAFAGVVKVDQSKVVSFSTDNPVFLRFQGGNTVQGPVAAVGSEVRVSAPAASGQGAVSTVEAVWLTSDQSPEARAARAALRSWAYEASADVLGKTGNSKSIASALGFQALLASPSDRLRFYANYARSEQDGAVTVNQARGGIDYSNNFSGRYSWYVREEIGTDKIQNLDFYSNTAAGFGYDVIKESNQTLTFRGGLAYRYESYKSGANVSAPALDLALIHDYSADTWKVGNRLTFLPSLEDFSNFRVLHDSFFEVPLAAGPWKLRLGVGNDYNSEPQPGKKKLDTTYYTKFVLSWR
jgi:hypothetical protein